LILEEQLDKSGAKIIKAILRMALDGDAILLRWCADRLLPARRDRYVEFDIGEVKDAAGALEANRRVLEAVASGKLKPSEGDALSRSIAVHVGLYSAVKLEQDIGTLEQAHGLAGGLHS
jgi:hypothetical protein